MNRLKRSFSSLVVAVTLLSIFVPINVISAATSSILYEYFNTGGDSSSSNITSSNYVAQIFSANVSHTITSVRVPIKLHGTNAGTITLAIKAATGSAGTPTGSVLASGTLDSTGVSTSSHSWYSFTLNAELSVNAGYYAIIISTSLGSTTNNIVWQRVTAGGYSGGIGLNSADGGITWTSDAPADYLFEVYGTSTLEVTSAKVYMSYKATGDWLIVCQYINVSAPYFDSSNVAELFNLQLINGSTVLASTKLAQWGLVPGCIYLSATSVTPLTWGSTYKVRIQANYDVSVYADYTLNATDWLGSDLTKLDSQCLSIASAMETYYSATLTTYISGKGKCLSKEGGVFFDTGIPQLSQIRPNIFAVTISSPNYTVATHSQALQGEYVWQNMVGTWFTSLFTDFGNTMNLSGKDFGAFVIMIFYVLISAFATPKAIQKEALLISLPILFIGFVTGLISLTIMGIIAFFAIFLFAYKMWGQNA